MPFPATFEALQAGSAAMLYLPRHRWRAEASLRLLADAGFCSVELVEGVDGHALDVRGLAESEGWAFAPHITPGEIGCALSVIRMWQTVVREGIPYLLAFEDDVVPHPDLPRVGPAYWRATPADADLLLLGGRWHTGWHDRRRRVVRRPTQALHAYAITLRGARLALALLRALPAFPREGLVEIDMEAKRWMEQRVLPYACWNGSMLRRPYPTEEDAFAVSTIPPVVIKTRCAAGVVYQNAAHGSSIWPEGSPMRAGSLMRLPLEAARTLAER